MPAAIWNLLANAPAELLPVQLIAGLVVAVGICRVAALLLRLVPQDEANRLFYRVLRTVVIAIAALLALTTLGATVILYVLGAFVSAPPAPS